MADVSFCIINSKHGGIAFDDSFLETIAARVSAQLGMKGVFDPDCPKDAIFCTDGVILLLVMIMEDGERAFSPVMLPRTKDEGTYKKIEQALVLEGSDLPEYTMEESLDMLLCDKKKQEQKVLH